ncbi:MAG: carboxylesterase family protein, partial [Streptosporangiaceae bacterium]
MSMTWTGARLAVAGLTLGALVAAAPAVNASTTTGGPVAGTANGAVRGLANGAVDKFLGIPYAAPPVGALRWQPPKPHAPWTTTLQATAYGSECAQQDSFGTVLPLQGSEDCLFVNVFSPPGAT